MSEVVSASLAISCHIAAVSLYFLERPGDSLPAEWDYQFGALVLVSLGLSLHSAFAGAGSGGKIPAILSIGVYLLVTYPLSAGSGVRLVLGVAVALSIASAFPRPDFLFVGLAFMLLALVLAGPVTAFGLQRRGALPTELLLLGFFLGLALAAGLSLKEFGEARRKSNRELRRLSTAIDRVTEINAGFQSALATAEADSILLERNRITREIHDIVGYTFTNQQMMLEAALVLASPENGRLVELLSMARDSVSDGLRETRKTLHELRRIDEPRNPDLAVFIKVARNFEEVTGVSVRLDFGNARGELDQVAWMSIYRLIQESMINAFRHGKANSIAITFREDERDFHVTVRDDGRGAGEIDEGIGLAGMRERIAALGGVLAAGNVEDGFVVSASIPRRAAGTVA